MKGEKQNMNKLFTKIAKLTLGLAMAAGVGVAVGAGKSGAGQIHAAEGDTLYSSGQFSSVSTHSYTQNKTFTLSSKSWAASVSQVNGSVFYLGCNSNNASKGQLQNNTTFTAVFNALKAADSHYNSNYSSCHAYALLFENAYNTVGEVTFTWNGGNNAFQIYLFGDKGSGYVLLDSENYATSGASVSGSVSWTATGDGENFTKFAIAARPGTTSGNATNKTLRPGTFVIKEGSSGGGDDPVAVTGVTLNKNSTSIEVGATETLTATVAPSDATDKSVTWKSYSDSACTTESSAIASVTSGGVVSGVAEGTAYIQVKTTDGNFTAKCTVTVVTPTWTDILDLDGKTAYVKTESGDYYLPNDITTTYVHPGYATSTTNAQAFDFTLVANNTYTIQAHGGTYNGYYLSANNSNGSSHKMFYHQTTPHNWTGSQVSGSFLLQDANNRYLTLQGTTDWRGYATRQNNQRDTLVFPIASTDPAITNVSLTGGPDSSTIGGGSTFKVTATVTAVNDTSETLSRNVNWTVTPSGAVTFSKTTSASGEEITVTAVNTANDDVVITASSAATGFTTVHADLTAFDIIKSYVINSVTLSATTAGGPTYDASGASSFVVGFTTAVNYTGDSGTGKVNITVSPTTGVSGYGDNKTAGAFDLTFTKSGTYSVTSTSVENNTKYQTVSITVNNIVIPGYELVTSTGSIRNGSQAVIHSAGGTYNMIMTDQNSGGYRNTANYTVSDGFIPSSDLPSGSEVITLVVSGSHWELKTSANKYLSLTEAGNKLYTSDSVDTTNNTTEWDISFNGNNVVITSVAYSARVIRCNGGSTRFACYEGTQQAIQLYVLVDTSPYFTVNTSSVYLGNRCSQSLQLTAHNGASDTVTWSSNSALVSVSPSSGLSTTVTAADSGTGTATVTATFASGDFDPIEVSVEVMELDTYVNIGVTTFTKVSSNSGDWSGTYLIVDETASKIFDGSASPLGASSEKDVTISSSQIAATTSIIASSFNIKSSTNGFTLKSNSNYYVGNRAASNGIMTSVGIEYEVSIANDGTITALLEDGSSSSTTLRHNNTDHIFRFYTSASGNPVSLYKADGEMRAISSTLTDFYDDVKANNYLSCNGSGSGSSIDFDGIVDCTGDLTTEDYDTLKRMSAKSAEDNGNFLEDFISDYDYLVKYKGATDIFGRFDEGGAMHGQLSPKINALTIIGKNTNTVAIIVIISMISVTAIGGYFFLRKRKEEN